MSDAWDLGAVLRTQSGEQPQPYAFIMLNTPVAQHLKSLFCVLWRRASVRICADGGANRLLALVGEDDAVWQALPFPGQICGDLDSLDASTRAFFSARGVPIVLIPSQYATDLQKGIQAIEDVEGDADAYELVIFGGLSGRLDQSMHTLHVLWQLTPGVPVMPMVAEPCTHDAKTPRGNALRKRARTLLISSESITCLLCAGPHTLLHDRAIFDETCGALPLGVDAAHITTSGLKWNLNGESSSLGGLLSTSNHLGDDPCGTVRLVTDAPVYWTVTLRDDL